MYSDVESLSVPLPEDIEKVKWYGDFAQAAKMIDLRLKTDIPEALKKRLRYEKEILSRIPAQYSYSWQDALKLLQEKLIDFKEEELTRLWEENAAEWIYIKGQIHFKDDFFNNLVKTRSWLWERLKDRTQYPSPMENEFLHQVIGKMKVQGGMACRFHVKSTLRIQKEAERENEAVKVYLPVPVEYAQVKNFRLLSVKIGSASDGQETWRNANPEEYTLSDAQYPQRTLRFHTIHHVGQTYSVEYSYETHMNYVDPKAEAVLDGQPAMYLEEQLPHIRFTPYLKEITAEIVGDEKNPLEKARKIYKYLTSHIMYSFVRSYITIPQIPDYVASGWKGDCGFQALLFITMCRIAKVPARWQSGLYMKPDSVGSHDWAQFYVAPYGWLFADVSFGGSAYRAGDEERRAFYFGNLDPYRMPAVSQFQHPFYPSMKWNRNDPYDNQAGEAEYEDRSLRSEEYETEHELVEFEEIERTKAVVNKENA